MKVLWVRCECPNKTERTETTWGAVWRSRVTALMWHVTHIAIAAVVHCTYRFIFESTAECPRDICSMFTVTPQHGTLSPTDRPANIQITFQSNREVIIKDQPILRCQVVEPTIGDSGEMIASIPIKVTVRSTFTKSVSGCTCINEQVQVDIGWCWFRQDALLLSFKCVLVTVIRSQCAEATSVQCTIKYRLRSAKLVFLAS